jgi:hypothetical protein
MPDCSAALNVTGRSKKTTWSVVIAKSCISDGPAPSMISPRVMCPDGEAV